MSEANVAEWQATGQNAVLVGHEAILSGSRLAVREYRVGRPKPYAQYPVSVSIFFKEGRERGSKYVTVTPGDLNYYTIERDGRVVYDSRTDVPCDMAEFEKKAAEFNDSRVRAYQRMAAAAMTPKPPPVALPPWETVITPGQKLDDKGRCCGCKPTEYKRERKLCCFRCDRAYDSETKEQIPNYHFKREPDGQFISKHPPGEVPAVPKTPANPKVQQLDLL